MSTMNRLANVGNKFQGSYKRVLCVCSAGMLRSPTAAWVLSQKPYNFNTRACGISDEYALIPIDDVMVLWADEIVCMNHDHYVFIKERYDPVAPMLDLGIPDNFCYRDPELVNLIEEKYNQLTGSFVDTKS